MANKVIVKAPIYENGKRVMNENIAIVAATGSSSSISLNENTLAITLKVAAQGSVGTRGVRGSTGVIGSTGSVGSAGVSRKILPKLPRPVNMLWLYFS